MKKIIFIAIFCFGFLSVTEAQTLKYEITNISNLKRYWAMDDAGPSPAQYELIILPGETRTGGVTNFAFPLDWKAGTYTSPNCFVSNTDFGPVLATTLPSTCPGVDVTYKIVEIVPFVAYIYKALLD